MVGRVHVRAEGEGALPGAVERLVVVGRDDPVLNKQLFVSDHFGLEEMTPWGTMFMFQPFMRFDETICGKFVVDLTILIMKEERTMACISNGCCDGQPRKL